MLENENQKGTLLFIEFTGKVKSLLEGQASDKGYSQGGADGRNELYEFIQKHVGANPHAHALGEVIYKVVRFAARGNPEDLEKAAAWLFLIRRHLGDNDGNP